MKRVLLVDDEGAPSAIIRYFIQKNQLPLEVVGEAQDGETAVDLIAKLRPDIVFLDIEMPGMNGLQVMERVRRTIPFHVTFIIITAYDTFSYVQKALQMGASDYLLKPVMYEQFLESLERVLGYRYSESAAFNELLEYIESNYSHEISMSDCEQVLSMSSSNIARLFKRHLNSTLITYLNEVRMRKAKGLLEEGVPIKEVADRVGFNSLNYFYRLFKNKYGITPKEYTQAHTGSAAL